MSQQLRLAILGLNQVRLSVSSPYVAAPARSNPWRDNARRKTVCLSICRSLLTRSRTACKWSQPLISGHELSLSFPSSLWWICPSSLPRSWALFNGLFQPWFARRKPLTNPFKDGSMDFMAPRALSPSFNKVKSKALSIRQWARGTLDAAVFNPTDATVHCMIAGASSQSTSPGDFSLCMAEQIYCCTDGYKVWAPWLGRRQKRRQKC